MAVNNSQYLSFLGGLVSPRLWLRSDMEKFGKWFATADNIRFHTVGSFENRFGTVKIAEDDALSPTSVGQSYNIKLLKFEFGQGESCVIVLGNRFFKVIVEDKYIQVENDDEEIVDLVVNTPIPLASTDDIKYVQSGDIIFLTNSKGIYEIKRLDKTWTKWEVVPFEFTHDIVPYGDENDDDNKTITLSSASLNPRWNFTLNSSDDGTNRVANVQIEFIGNGTTTTYTSTPNTWMSFSDLETGVSAVATTRNLSTTISGNSLYFQDSGATDVETIQVYYEYLTIQRTTTLDNITISGLKELYAVTPNKYRYNNGSNVEIKADGLVNYKFKNGYDVTPVTFYANSRATMSDVITSINTYISALDNPQYGTTGNFNICAVQDGTNTCRIATKLNVTGPYNASGRPDGSGGSYGSSFTLNTFTDTNNIEWYRNYTEYQVLTPTTYNVEVSLPVSATYYSAISIGWSANDGFFADKSEGETFMLRNIIEADYIHATKTGYTTSTVTTETATVQTMLSDGNWRYNSSGLWSGSVKLEYSTDGGSTWITFFNRKNSSYSNYSTTNDNTSGKIETDKGTILLRMTASNISEDNDAKFAAELAVDKFEVNSVYKIAILYSNQPNNAIVECVKGNIGIISANAFWREAVFSNSKGYPTAIGFYQNRLYLGKEYNLYGSRINDFWDFYEPIEVADDDPITMSLLGYKINNIQNLIGIRSFFTFTTDGEFGIGSDNGALTQATKYLKQISAHGSNPCNPIFCGDVILFVDKTNNTVRAFKYSLEADGWEATDVSVLIEQVLEDEQIVTTEYLQDSKECLFLTASGKIFVFKFFPEQNIAAWSVIHHAKYDAAKVEDRYIITNLCSITDANGKDYLYIACDTPNGKQIELFKKEFYCDSTEEYSSDTAFTSVTTTFQKDDKVVVNDGTDQYLSEVGAEGVVTLRNSTKYATVGLSYTSTATLLSPEIQDRDGTFSTYNRKKPFKAHFFYRDSYGFKVGVEEEGKQEIQFQPPWSTIDDETALTTGKNSVLMPSKYNGSARVSFVQDKPYPMIIENILLEADYGGK